MESLIGAVDMLQEQLAARKQHLKDVDSSIKRLNGNEKNRQNNGSKGDISLDRGNSFKSRSMAPITRRVSLNEADNVRSMKRKSYDDQKFSNSKRNSSLNDPDSADEDGYDKPTIKSSVVSSAMPIKTKEDLIKIQNKGANVQRNKRLFGHLLGTLSQFKNDDKIRSSTTSAIHRKELEKKIEIQKIEEKIRHTEEKKKLEEDKNREQQNIEILESKIRIASEFENWKKNQLQYKNFIRTKSKPFVFYLPKRFDEATEILVKETASLIDEQIGKRLKETEAELAVLTKKAARLNNEKEDIGNNENKENKQNPETLESDNDEMDDEKNAISVRLGDDEEEEAADTSRENDQTANTTTVTEVIKDRADTDNQEIQDNKPVEIQQNETEIVEKNEEINKTKQTE